jgi:parvulin-like peptidyl-prolyl isomerase
VPPTFRLRLYILASLVVVLVPAGCGSSSLPKDAAASTCGETISRASLASEMAATKARYRKQGARFPQAGSASHLALRNQTLAQLVDDAATMHEAGQLGVHVSAKTVDAKLADTVRRYFGDKRRFKRQLVAQGTTPAHFRADLRMQLVRTGVQTKLEHGLAVSAAEVHAYYEAHRTQYQPAPTRDVARIVVKTRAIADQVEAQLQHGESFDQVLERYSLDKTTPGGKVTIARGQTAPTLDKVVFELDTGAVAPPVHAPYGWLVIKALSATRKSGATSFATAKDSIRHQLLQVKRDQAFARWTASVRAGCEAKAEYAHDLAP